MSSTNSWTNFVTWQEKISKDSQKKKETNEGSLFTSESKHWYNIELHCLLVVDTHSKAELVVCEVGKIKSMLKDYTQSSSLAKHGVHSECHSTTATNGRLSIVLQALTTLPTREQKITFYHWLLPFHFQRTKKMFDFWCF